MAQKNFVSNKDESARLFESPFLEFFTHVHWTVPLIVFLPLISYFLYDASANRGLSALMIGGFFIGGVAVWTLTEYILHRFVFHYEPSSTIGRRLHFLLHGVHHDYPNDSWRLVMPPVVSVPLAALFYYLFLPIVGSNALPAFFAGFLIGYLCYDMIHYATHHAPMKGVVGLLLKQHHMRHHYQTDEFNFGVSSPFWDHIFRTYREKGEMAEQT